MIKLQKFCCYLDILISVERDYVYGYEIMYMASVAIFTIHLKYELPKNILACFVAYTILKINPTFL